MLRTREENRNEFLSDILLEMDTSALVDHQKLSYISSERTLDAI